MKPYLILFFAFVVCTQSQAACVDDLKQAADKQLNSGPMRVVVDSEIDDVKSQGLIEIAPPDTWHQVDSMGELYTNGKTSWRKITGLPDFDKQDRGDSIYALLDFVLDNNFRDPNFKSDAVTCSEAKEFEGKTYRAVEYSNFEGQTLVSVYLSQGGAPEVIFVRTDDPNGIIKVNHQTYRITYDPNLTLKMPD